MKPQAQKNAVVFSARHIKSLNKWCVVSSKQGTQSLWSLYGLWIGLGCDDTDKQWLMVATKTMKKGQCFYFNEVPIQTY